MASSIPQHVQSDTSSAVPHASPRAPRNRPSPHPSPQHSSPRSNSPRTAAPGALDVEGLVRHHGGDVRKALEVVAADRNQLQAQNTQLWKLIEKQRASCAQLNSDNERLRADREKANTRLAAAGLDTVGHSKKMTNSVSAVGLGIRADAPPPPHIPRRNSDRDEPPQKEQQGSAAGSSTTPIPQSTQAAPAPTPPAPAQELLPSAIPSTSRLRHESRIVFPPEVTSFMTLAESPKESEHSIPASTSTTTISPTSNYSTSPATSTNDSHAVSVAAPSSSRPLAVMTEVSEEDETQFMAPPRISSLKSPSMESTSTASSFHSAVQSPPQPVWPQAANGNGNGNSNAPPGRPSLDVDMETPRPSQETTARQSHDQPSSSQPRPSHDTSRSRPLPRMTPALLPHARITIPDTTIYPNALGRDVLCFIINVTIRPPSSPPMTWHCAKLLSAFIDLDTTIRVNSGKRTKEWKAMVAPLPDGKAWKDFAPSKIDQRKSALETYLQSLQVAPLSDKVDLCEFLSTDPVHVKEAGARKEGYLTKKGKNFGGWKTRYFVLNGPVMEYFETRGGQALGSITITNAQIGRQNRPSESSEERDFRHAFLIIEQAKKGGQTRHVLCAASDTDRDSWIEVLVQHVDPKAAPTPLQGRPASPEKSTAPPAPTAAVSPTTTAAPPATPNLQRKRSGSKKLSKDVVVTNAQPLASMPAMPNDKFGNAPSPSLINSMETQKSTGHGPHSSSLPSNSLPSSSTSTHQSQAHSSSGLDSIAESAAAASSSSANGQDDAHTPRPAKRQSSVPLRHYTPAYLTKLSSEGLSAPPGYPTPDVNNKDRDRKAKSGRFWPSFGKTPEKVLRPVFGVTLNESLAIASVASLPAIVFRCIEYLEAKHAQDEEGIYRLSGSSAVIKGLKERFDTEGDVNLLKVDDHWDPHAIAGLLKSYLRELPTSLLTRDLHPKFLAVMDLIESNARVAELSRLVGDLPPPNYALLRALTAHLILIVKNCAVNKMTLRNIGIVFSPTLGIPAGIFSELVSHFGAIFDAEPEPAAAEEEAPAQGQEEAEDTMKRKRNSMLYQAAGADAMLGLGGRSLDPMLDDSASEASIADFESEAHSAPSSEQHHSSPNPATGSPTTPKADKYPAVPGARRVNNGTGTGTGGPGQQARLAV